MYEKSLIGHILISAMLMSCNSSVETKDLAGSALGAQNTLVRSFDPSGKAVSASCLAETPMGLERFETPSNLQLPVNDAKAEADIIVTCSYEGAEKTAILTSKRISDQRQANLNRSAQNEVLASEFGGEDSVNYGDFGNFLALGLSTTIIPPNYYVYPSLVNIRF